MTNEEMQNTIQFILDQQAQLTVNVDKLGEKVDEIAEKVDKLADNVEKLTDNVDRIADNVEKLTDNVEKLTDNVEKLTDNVYRIADNVGRIAEAQIAHERRTTRLEESFQMLVQLAENMDGRMDTLTEAQSRTDEQLAETDKRLNALIGIVERYISEGRNGNPQG